MTETEKIFDGLLQTENGREVIFNILSTALFYKQNTIKAHNPFVKQLGRESITVQQVRKLLFQNLAEFEELIAKLYTFDGSVSYVVDDLTSGAK